MKPQNGDTVRVHYTGTLDDGSQFDSSVGRDPIEFIVGSGMVIDGFDAAVTQLEVGGKTTVRIPCEDAYGPHDPGGVHALPISGFGEEAPPAGAQIMVPTGTGQVVRAQVVSVDEETVTLDLNHPLAGQALTFELELVEIDGK